jgi:hypothetical protein
VDGAEGALTERDPDAALKELIRDQMRIARDRAGWALLARVRDREIAAARARVNHEAGSGGGLPAKPPPPVPAKDGPDDSREPIPPVSGLSGDPGDVRR